MKKLAAIGALGLMASGLFGQGLTPPSGQAKDDWEEINFEFNSSILSDGYPSLLRLAELLNQHKDYQVTVTGHTDFVGSVNYNDRLALARANTVKDFLVKYGAPASQISTNGQGKSNPEVNNNTKEGRFMNRRVVLRVTNGAGQVVKEGTIREVLNAIPAQPAPGGLSNDCCNNILRRLDKLDEILAAVKALQGDNDKLRGELADLQKDHNALKDQLAGIPKPLTEQQTQTIANNAASGALDEAQRRNKKFSLLGLNIGPTYGPDRSTGDITVSGSARFFSPFGGDGTHAVQAQGEYMYFPGSQEGQFDIGLVNRFGHVQVGGFGSFKALDFRQFQSAGFLGQGAFLFDYIFSRGRIGGFATKGFKNIAVLNSTTVAPGLYLQNYARIVDQYGFNGLVGTWGNAYLEGNIGYLRMNGPGNDKPGGTLKLVQPLNDKLSFTAEVGLNETYVQTANAGRVVFGLEFGNYIRPKDYGTTTSPVPMDVPRVRYQFLTRLVGNSAPVADAGPNQIGVPAGTITLDGSGSYDPAGGALTYSWQQTFGPSIALTGANTVKPTFTAAAGQQYSFRLTVTNPAGLKSTASTTVTTASPTTTPTPSPAQILRFDANPTNIQPGGQSTLSWTTSGATKVSISGVGAVTPNGSTTVSPQATTTYTITATAADGTSVTAPVTVTVTTGTIPQVVTFVATPQNISAGQSTKLCWQVTNATSISITPGVGSNLNGNDCATVSPTQTTTYTLTATNATGQIQAQATVNVGQVQVLSFNASPVTSTAAGAPVTLSWTTANATSVVLIGSEIPPQTLPVNGSIVVNPITNSVYTLTAYGPGGQTVSVSISVFVR
ncbi:MAG TPA: OmpA family protein [Bryobacteraceae bacterium]|jgi:hypothetical protein|nr:OmpA family protein [Bryobacteraceae bacterium]